MLDKQRKRVYDRAIPNERKEATEMKSSIMHKLSIVCALILVSCMFMNSASACTSIYVGSKLTTDGSTIFGRSEDYANSYAKLFYVSPSGNHTAGEEYKGCYGFTWTFTHDSYSYTAFRDNNGEGVAYVCPDCGETHTHTPYEAAGTNDQGVTITATETIHGGAEVSEVDPFTDEGIEEAEIPTIILSEAASAKEAVELLLSIYDTVGANNGSGIFIADKTETWYVENVTGHQYVAVKLTDDMVISQPNMSIIAEIDLDDTENVIASAGLIDVAQQAGTFVGDKDANIINYVLSYNGKTAANARMIDALGYLDVTCSDPAASTEYLISNVKDGQIVPMYTGIQIDKQYSIADVQNYFHIPSIGKAGNTEVHLFQIYAEDGAKNTVEWVAMDDAALSPFIPFYPMLTTDVYDAYKVSAANATFSEEEPADGLYYAATTSKKVDGQRVTVEGFKKVPENWADSMYWTFDGLSNLVLYGNLDETTSKGVYDAIYAKQAEINAAFDAAKDTLDTAEAATAWSAQIAQDAHALGVELANGLLNK